MTSRSTWAFALLRWTHSAGAGVEGGADPARAPGAEAVAMASASPRIRWRGSRERGITRVRNIGYLHGAMVGRVPPFKR